MLKKANVVLSCPAKPCAKPGSFENREHMKDIFVLLMTVDKRMKAARPEKKAKEASVFAKAMPDKKPRKTKKTKKYNKKGSLFVSLFYCQIREVFLF